MEGGRSILTLENRLFDGPYHDIVNSGARGDSKNSGHAYACAHDQGRKENRDEEP